MRSKRLPGAQCFGPALVVAVFCVLCLPARAGDPPFAPISPSDLAMKEVPGAPGASAVILERVETTDDQAGEVSVYIRRKILTHEGMKYADVEIPFIKDLSEIRDVKARTIHPDGTIVEYTGKPFDKMVVKARDLKFMAKTFTMPEVTEGSIVEYRYKYQRNFWVFGGARWSLQDELFTVHERFHYVPRHVGLSVNYVYAHFPNSAAPPKQSKDGQVDVEMTNVPALVQEDYMPPRDVLVARVRIFYGLPDEMKSPEEFWKHADKDWYDDEEKFIGHSGTIKDAIATIVAATDPPEAKARKIYAKVQSLRNLTYEREKSEQERKAENLKETKDAEDVWKRGYGYHRDLNRLYVALALAAGLDARVIRVSERDDSFFDKNVMSRTEMPTEVVLLNLEGKEIYLDPGMRYCPFGRLPWYRSGVTAMKLDKDGGTFIHTPDPTIADGIIKRTANVMLDRDGTLHGQITVQFTGLSAVAWRAEEREEDAVGRTKALESEVRGWFAQQASVKLIQVNSWDDTDTPLEATFTVEVPGYASATGKRLLAPRGIFAGNDEYLFQKEQRLQPVYLHYPFEHYDVVVLSIPASFQFESLPAEKTVQNEVGRYLTRHKAQGNTVRLERLIGIFRYGYPTADYPKLRGFMSDAKNSDDEPIVLTVSDAKNH